MALMFDHLFCFVDPNERWPQRASAAGWNVMNERAHPGQGTSNRCVCLSDCYIELLWLSSRAEAENNPVRLDRRADWRITGASPLGFGLMGDLSDELRQDFWPYCPPYAPGQTIWIHKTNETEPSRPLVFVVEADDATIEERRSSYRAHATHAHFSGVSPPAIRGIALAAPVAPPPLLSEVLPPVRWRPAATPHVTLIIGSQGTLLELTDNVAIES